MHCPIDSLWPGLTAIAPFYGPCTMPFALCVFRLCPNIKTNLFHSNFFLSSYVGSGRNRYFTHMVQPRQHIVNSVCNEALLQVCGQLSCRLPSTDHLVSLASLAGCMQLECFAAGVFQWSGRARLHKPHRQLSICFINVRPNISVGLPHNLMVQMKG
jgi:hypothetical protein